MKSKDPKDNLVVILLIFFGTFIGCVLTLASVLTFFILYKKKLKKRTDKDVEYHQPVFLKTSNIFNDQNLNQKCKKKKYQNVLHVKKILNNKKNQKKYSNKFRIADDARDKLKPKGKFKCQNNNTLCTNLIKTMKITLDTSNSSSKESLSDSSSFYEKNSFISISPHHKIVELKQFKPLCTSSPLLPLIAKSSHNTTFNFSRSNTDTNNTDFEISSFKNDSFSPKETQLNYTKRKSEKLKSISNRADQLTESVIKINHCNYEKTIENNEHFDTYRNNNDNCQSMFKKSEDNLFDPKYTCSEESKTENKHDYSVYLNGIAPFCCRRLINAPEVFNNREILKQSFTNFSKFLKFGNSEYECIFEQYVSDLDAFCNNVFIIKSINKHYVLLGFHSNVVYFTKSSRCSSVSICSTKILNCNLCSANDLNSLINETKTSEIIKKNSFENLPTSFNTTTNLWCNLRKLNKIYFQEINKHFHSIKELKVHDFEISKCSKSINIRRKLTENLKLQITDNTWKGRSRKIKENQENFK